MHFFCGAKKFKDKRSLLLLLKNTFNSYPHGHQYQIRMGKWIESAQFPGALLKRECMYSQLFDLVKEKNINPEA